MTALTLPGTVLGLLRRGSPVVHALRWSGVVHEVAESSAVVCTTCYAMRDLALDLTDATGRAHAAWWLAGCTGVSWALDCDGHRRWTLHGGEAPRDAFCRSFEGVGPEVRRMRGAPPAWGWDAEDVPALDHLNPDDDTRLPDGSRWVDAEALRLVCLHVAGVLL